MYLVVCALEEFKQKSFYILYKTCKQYLTRVRGITRNVPSQCWEGDGIDAWSKHRLAKYVKICTYWCYVGCATIIVRVRGMPWLQTGPTQYHTQLGLPDKGLAIKRLVVCNNWDV